MIKLLIIGGGGFLGAVSRYLISSWVARHSDSGFPWGTLVVNLAGCFLLGFCMQLVQTRDWFTPQLRMLVTVGFLGSLTTFSTFGYETLVLLEKDPRAALGNVLLNLVLGVLGVMLGRAAIPA